MRYTFNRLHTAVVATLCGGFLWPTAMSATGPAASQPVPRRSASLPSQEIPRVIQAVERARGFLKALEPKIDPVALRNQQQMKGVKFYVEYLNAWRNIHELSDEAGRNSIRDFLEPVAARTDKAAFHKLARVPDDRFDQDIISYLNACVLHKYFGFDTTRFDREIEDTVPRILSSEHLARRGVDNTMALVYRLRQLGYSGGPSFCEIWNRPNCVTRLHPALAQRNFKNYHGRYPVYAMTHEIFYLTEYGQTPMQCVGEQDLVYIRRMHSRLIPLFIDLKDHDAVAELVMCLNYLQFTDLPEYIVGYRHLLDHQNDDGSWGDEMHIAENSRDLLKANPRYLLDVGQYLHTTQVTLDALCYPWYGKPLLCGESPSETP